MENVLWPRKTSCVSKFSCLWNLLPTHQSGPVCPFLQSLPALHILGLVSDFTREAPKEVAKQQLLSDSDNNRLDNPTIPGESVSCLLRLL